MSIDDDLAFYNEIRPDLVASVLNQYVLIKDRKLIDAFPTFAAALTAASSQGYAPGSYLIKQVLDPEPVHRI